MGWVFLLINLSVIFACSMIRFEHRGYFVACPVPTSYAVGFAALGVAILLMAGLIVARASRPREGRRAFWELMAIFPVAFAWEWLFAPAEKWRVVDWAGAAALLALIVLFLWRDRADWRRWGLSGANFVPAVKRLAIPTLLFVAAPALATGFVGSDYASDRVKADLAGYPFYALGQLAIFQLFLVNRLRKVCTSRAEIIVAAAGMFAMLHWPNGPLMAGTLVAGAAWTWVYLERPNLIALALAMALSAVAFSDLLPRDFTQNMRTGPWYVQRKLDFVDHREPPHERRYGPWLP